MICLYLPTQVKGLTPSEALDYIRERRPQISVNERQQGRLAEYQSQLKKKE